LIVKHVDDVSVRVGTVDGFQGQEADIVVISCTRTKQLGFLEDERRLNVALTRARECLLIVGSADFMRQKSGPWKELVDDAAQRDCLHPVVSAGPGHVDGQSVSTPDYDARVLETKVETQELELAGRSKTLSGPGLKRRAAGGGEANAQLAAKKTRIAEEVRKGVRVFQPKRVERQAGRQPQQQPQQQRRVRVVVNTSPAQKRMELERRERRELQGKLDERRRREDERRRLKNNETRRGSEQRGRGGDDLRGRLGKSVPPPSNNRRPDDDDRWEWG
jgi:senataxin